jgi:hypothetical protein
MSTPSSVVVALLLLASAAGEAAAQSCSNGIGSCLAIHPTPGCDDPACCQTVCSADPLCCITTWDADCVTTANQSCFGLCGADVNGSCLVPHSNPSCDDATCCELVCGTDPFCCSDSWDFNCAFVASLICKLGGAGTCGGPGEGDCFRPQPDGACSDAACCEAVCQLDETCCSVVWDVLCVEIAFSICNPGCTVICTTDLVAEQELCGQSSNDPCFFPSESPQLQTIPVGGGACGQLAPTPGPDVDVWRITLTDGNGDGLVGVQLSFASGFDGFAALVPDACGPLTAAFTSVDTDLCVEILSPLVCVPPGTYRIVVAQGNFPSIGGPELFCGAGNNYSLRVLVSELACLPPCNPDAGPCFVVHKSPGCEDEACCKATCAQDPSCCAITWDSDCAALAIELCAETPVNDTCAGAVPVTAGVTPFANFGATDGPPEAPSCLESGGNVATADLWFRYRPTADGFLTAATCGQPITFNSAVAVYSGACSGLTLLGCDDDAAGVCLPLDAASVTVAVDCGVDYLIRVGGGSGTGSLTLTPVGGPSCPPPCPADLDGNGTVAAADLSILLAGWGGSGIADLDGNGSVGASDLTILLSAWGPCP